MVHVVVLGAGLGGTIMAYELRDLLGREHKVSVVNKGSRYSFVPSNPWVAVGWRDRDTVSVDLEPVLRRRDIALYPQGAKRLDPKAKSIALMDGTSLDYDYLVIATGPDLAFDEIPGFGPAAETNSVCFIDHALEAILGARLEADPMRHWACGQRRVRSPILRNSSSEKRVSKRYGDWSILVVNARPDPKVRRLHARHKLAWDAPAPMVNRAATEQIWAGSHVSSECDPGV